MANWAKYQAQLVGLPIAKRARHGIHFARPDGLIRADFVGKPCHWLDTDSAWKEIDTALKPIGAEFGAPGIPIRFRKNGLVVVGTHAQQTNHIGLFNPMTKAFSVLATLPNGLILDNTLIRELGIFREEIRLTEDGVREELIVASMPSGGAGDWLVLETRVRGGDFADGDTAEFSREGYRFPLPSAVDANGKRILAKRFARKIGAAQYLLTGVPLTAMQGAAFPVTVDPDFSAGADYSRVYGSSNVYATARSTAVASGDGYQYAGQSLAGGATYYVTRFFFSYDTSTLGAGATVLQVNETLVCAEDYSDVDFNLQIVEYAWASPITADNREAAFDDCLAQTGSILWRNTSGMSVDTPYTSANMTTGYVNKTGITYYSHRSDRDKAATTPTGPEQARWADPTYASAYRPVLMVVYSAAASPRIFGSGFGMIKGG